MVTYRSLTPNLMVENVNETLNYYRGVLGFEMISSVPATEEGELAWAMVRKDDVELMFQEEDNLKKDLPELRHEEPGGGFTLFLKMEGINALYDQLYEKADIVDEMRETFYGMREFTIRDVNGYYITFAEPIQE